MSADLDGWIARSAATPDVQPGDARLVTFDAAPVVFLGETNHFVREKTEFRLWWLRRLAATRRLVVGEELSFFDGLHVERYLLDGNEEHLSRLATFGDRSHARGDRDDSPTGVLRASFDAYPTEAFAAEQARFYRGLLELRPARFFGFDVDAPGDGYDEVPGLGRVGGESVDDEIARLEAASGGELVETIAATLRYTRLAHPAPDYESLRPAMALREDLMKLKVGRELGRLGPRDVLVLLAHAFHLARDDAGIAGGGVGPGGGRSPSLGHHLVRERGVHAASVWMVYGEGSDSQPFPDLPSTADYPPHTLNARLARFAEGRQLIVPTTGVDAEVDLGHMYNATVRVRLRDQADAVHFVPVVSPLTGSE